MHWSFSGLMTYEACAYRFKLKFIDKMPEPPREPGNPLERGNRIHKSLEDFVTGATDILTNEPKAIAPFQPALERLRLLYQHGMVSVEQDWVFNDAYEEIDKWDKSRYVWVKVDFNVQDRENLLVITGDHKSGKSQYKAIEHVQQTQFYAGISALKYPWAQRHITELWYADEGWVRGASYTQEEALKFIGRFDTRAQRIYSDKLFRPNPSKLNCKYCPYGKQNGTGFCAVAV